MPGVFFDKQHLIISLLQGRISKDFGFTYHYHSTGSDEPMHKHSVGSSCMVGRDSKIPVRAEWPVETVSSHHLPGRPTSDDSHVYPRFVGWVFEGAQSSGRYTWRE